MTTFQIPPVGWCVTCLIARDVETPAHGTWRGTGLCVEHLRAVLDDDTGDTSTDVEASSHSDTPHAHSTTAAPRLTDNDERRIRSVILEWLNEAEIDDAQDLAKKIAANLRPSIDSALARRYRTA